MPYNREQELTNRDNNKPISNKDRNMQEFEYRLAQFTKTAYDLLESWNSTDHTGAYWASDYPFSKSFDEVCLDIIQWRDTNTDIVL